VDVLFNLGADECEVAPGAFVIYQGTHGDRGATRADVILPGAAYTEKNATYVNLEGRVQVTNRSAFPPGDAREDWAILRALSDVVGQRLPFDSLVALRKALYAEHPHMAGVERIAEVDTTAAVAALAGRGGAPERAPFVGPITDFYLTNPIARASRVLAECSNLANERSLEAAE
jgi:NADH-quinone oxidoreductase subunit G